MAANDLASALDPTKKKPIDPSTLTMDGGGVGWNQSAPVDPGMNLMAGRVSGDTSQMDPNYKQTFGTDQNPGGSAPAPAPAAPQAFEAPRAAPQIAAPAPAAAPAAPAGIAAGWEDVGYGNMVRNSTTGQMVDRNHPVYQQALTAGQAPAAPAAATPGASAAAPAPGGDALPAGASDMGNGLVKFADGQVLPKNHPAYAAKVAAAGGAAAATQGAPAGAASPAAPATPAGPTTTSAFQDALMKLLNPEEVSTSSASIAPAIEANKLAEQRGEERQRNILAEQAAQDGTDMSGGFRTNLIGLDQDRAAREGKFAGDAVQHAKDQQTSSILAALGIGGNYETANADRAQKSDQFGKSLTEQGREADIDNSTKMAGITSQADLGNKDLALRDKLGSGQLNLGVLGQLLGDKQAGNTLGATLGMHNQDAILKLLGMA